MSDVTAHPAMPPTPEDLSKQVVDLQARLDAVESKLPFQNMAGDYPRGKQ
jgi:hypothetical protein